MVRLLPLVKSDELIDPTFQSHNGAIAAALHEEARRRKARFQSHNGAIAASCCLCLRICVPDISIPQWCDCCESGFTPHQSFSSYFNPTMVRLLLLYDNATLDVRFNFNPTMVRLLLTVAVNADPFTENFNPTMVRLLRNHSVVTPFVEPEFQSHNGAIAAEACGSSVPLLILFQSHNGAIAAASKDTFSPASVAFQSHNGAIAARYVINDC